MTYLYSLASERRRCATGGLLVFRDITATLTAFCTGERTGRTGGVVGVVASILLTIIIGAQCVSSASHRDTSCRIAHTALTQLARTSAELLDSARLAPDGPDLMAYQAWSDRLQGFVSQAADSGIAASLQEIAEVSSLIVIEVARLRRPVQRAGQAWAMSYLAYLTLLKRLDGAESALVEKCRQ